MQERERETETVEVLCNFFNQIIYMRKLRVLSFIAFLVILAACNKEADQPYQELELPVSFNSLVFGDARTRVTGDSWDSGDKIGVFAVKIGRASCRERV